MAPAIPLRPEFINFLRGRVEMCWLCSQCDGNEA